MMLARMESFNETRPKKRPRFRLFGLTGRNRAVWLAVGWTAVFLGWLAVRMLVRPTQLFPAALNDFLLLIEFGAAITLVILWTTLYWQRARARTEAKLLVRPLVPALSREEMYALTPAEFEAFVGKLFTQKEYTVTMRGRTGDLGVDLEIERDGRQSIVQCKRYQNTVGPDIVRELYGTLLHERVSHAYLVTSADISPAARAWARGKPMTLIDGDTLAQIAGELATIDGSLYLSQRTP